MAKQTIQDPIYIPGGDIQEESIVSKILESPVFQQNKYGGLLIDDCDLNDSTFNQVDLLEFKIFGCVFAICTVTDMKLQYSHFKDSQVSDLDWTDLKVRKGIFQDATFTNGPVTNGDFSNSRQEQVTYTNIQFQNVTFDGSQFENVLFDSCTFTNCSFENLVYKNTTFQNCTFSGVGFEGNFSGTMFIGTTGIGQVKTLTANGIKSGKITNLKLGTNAEIQSEFDYLAALESNTEYRDGSICVNHASPFHHVMEMTSITLEEVSQQAGIPVATLDVYLKQTTLDTALRQQIKDALIILVLSKTGYTVT